MKYYSYEDFKTDTNKLIQKVQSSNIDAIVGIARGGLTLSHAVAEGLDIREVHTIRTELYDKSQKREKITIFGKCDFSDAKTILVLDDISDSGDTLKSIMSHLKTTNKNITFITATLFYKKTSVYEPTVWINEAKEWIEFFWEKDFNKQ